MRNVNESIFRSNEAVDVFMLSGCSDLHSYISSQFPSLIVSLSSLSRSPYLLLFRVFFSPLFRSFIFRVKVSFIFTACSRSFELVSFVRFVPFHFVSSFVIVYSCSYQRRFVFFFDFFSFFSCHCSCFLGCVLSLLTSRSRSKSSSSGSSSSSGGGGSGGVRSCRL